MDESKHLYSADHNKFDLRLYFVGLVKFRSSNLGLNYTWMRANICILQITTSST